VRTSKIVTIVTSSIALAAAGLALAQQEGGQLGNVEKTMKSVGSKVAAAGRADVKLMTLDPGHFHAALIQRESYPGVAAKVDVYAPLGPDLFKHLERVARFNSRADKPTDWRLEVHTGPDFLERMKKEKPGNVVVISGRNRGKIDYIQGSVASGFHALVDKPWILASDDFKKLKDTLDLADKKGRIALDIMTERFEITSILQKELVNDAEVFGEIQAGTAQSPGVYMESVHHLLKMVAGAPNLRPAWFFDGAQQGEGLNDIGTHLVDLVQWTVSAEKPIDYQKDVEVLAAHRWPTVIPLASFQKVTGEKEFPAFLAKDVKNGALDYFCNTLVTYKLKGVHTKLNVIWDWEAPAGGGDTHYAYYRGSKAKVEVRQGKAEKWKSELFVTPADPAKKQEVMAAVGRRLTALSEKFPGLSVDERGKDIHVVIPDRFRTSHEEHFGEVARRFFGFLKNPRSLPAWEKPNMLSKYWTTTKGTELSRQGPPKVAERIAPK
jgi:predicted dehydrogenase